MFLALVILSLGLISTILYGASARVWFPLWRRERSGTAHSLFLTNCGLALVVVFKIIQVVGSLIEAGECEFPFNLVSAIIMSLVAVFQFALSKGYFNPKEKENVS